MDGRGERGDRTRKSVVAQAAAIASVDGLSGMTLSQLADTLGVSKSSVQAAFKTKEEVQLAAVAAATEIFVGAVVAPALAAPEGLARLQLLVESWLSYVERRVLPGGCFMGATSRSSTADPVPCATRWRSLDEAGSGCSNSKPLSRRPQVRFPHRPAPR